MAKKEKKDQKQAAGGKKKKEVEIIPTPDGYIPRMQQKYADEVIDGLKKKFNYDNIMQVPTVKKVVLNVGIGDAHQDQRLLDSVVDELTIIAGQKPVVTRARKSISNFKLREGMQVGVRVTMRRAHMWEFLDRFFNLTLPRVRDFRGVSDKSFDGRGNYSMGIIEQIVFPEIDYDKVVRIHGMDLTIVTSAETDEEALELLKLLGCPFRKRQTEEAVTA